jgi:uncharacterized protein
MRASLSVPSKSFVAFFGNRLVASGDLRKVSLRAKRAFDTGELRPLLLFDDLTSELVEVDFRGSPEEVAARIDRASAAEQSEPVQKAPPGPGRPKLGVVGREVTLLPRHWRWLDSQPGGASVTLRKLVEEAKRANAGQDRFRVAQEATYRFMRDMAGDLPGYEEATRVLFSSSQARLKPFEARVAAWPADIRRHVLKLFRRTLTLERARSKVADDKSTD